MFAGNLVSNTWLLIIEPANTIPTESSIWGFSPTVMNSGSGDWWIYGEDEQNFYYFTGSAERPYVVMSKSAARDCVGFDSTDHLSWCDT